MDSKLKEISICTFNANGLADERKLVAVLNSFKNANGIILLQETHSTITNEKNWKVHWDRKIEFCHGSSSRG